MKKHRIEVDSLGEVRLSGGVLWGAQTQRGIENFGVSPYRIPLPMLRALALVKEAAADTNGALQLVERRLTVAIAGAAREIQEGGLDDHFPIDVFQTGSGTSWNMNINEVIANSANISLGGRLGEYTPIHPNDHVNRGQSSNDVIPTSINIAARREASTLVEECGLLAEALWDRAEVFSEIPKLGRTHLQDGVVMTLGQEFSGYATQIEKGAGRIASCFPNLEELPIGGTAVGTGLNTHPGFGERVTAIIAAKTKLPFRQAANRFEAIAARDSNLELMSGLNSLSVSLMKICQDLRLLSSGPRAGLGEITLPSLQPGSSIMPGKVNPVIPEMIIQVAAHIMGKHLSVTVACQNAPLELNIMQPLIAFELLSSLELLTHSIRRLRTACIPGIQANAERCLGFIEMSLSLLTPLANEIGYDETARLVAKARSENRTVRAVVEEAKILPGKRIEELLSLDNFLGE